MKIALIQKDVKYLCITSYLSAGSDKNHAGDSTWWVTDLADFHLSERF